MTHQPLHRTSRIPRLARYSALGVIASFSLLGFGRSVIAQESNFGRFSLNLKTQGAVVDGTTGGSTSLSAITTNLDRDDNQCFGFGDPRPDHILNLEKPVDRLKLTINSRGTDTTLVIQAPDGSFLCADDFGNSKDAGLESPTWKSGQYKLWIGTVRPGQRHAYQLSVQAN